MTTPFSVMVSTSAHKIPINRSQPTIRNPIVPVQALALALICVIIEICVNLRFRHCTNFATGTPLAR